MPLPLHEIVETIVLAYLQSGCTSGRLGSLRAGDLGVFHVTTGGREFVARTVPLGWSVTCAGFEGLDRSLIDAARLALDGVTHAPGAVLVG